MATAAVRSRYPDVDIVASHVQGPGATPGQGYILWRRAGVPLSPYYWF